MTTTTRHVTPQEEHTAEARRLLAMVNRVPKTREQLNEYTSVFARDPQAVAAVASAHIALAQLEEQHTANLIAADRLDTILSPHGVGGDEYNAFWAKHAGNITQRLGMGA